MTQPKRLRGEAGFTLPEVLMTVAILALIMVAITGAMLVTIGPDQQAADRLVASHDGQLLALHLPQDLQSAAPILAGDSLPGATLSCTGAVGTNVLRLAWAQQGTPYEVSYRLVNEAGERRLIRLGCTGGALSRLVVAHDLASGSAATASVDGAVVSITVTGRTGRTFTVSGSRRTPDDECRVTHFSLAYTELALGDPSGHLSEDVLATVELIGPCAGVALNVVFTPNGGQQTLPLLPNSGTPRMATIGMNAHTWSVGNETFEVVRADGLPLQSPVAVLTLTLYVVPCVVESITPAPSSVTLDATSHLDQDVVVDVTTSGPCADLELLFSTTAAGPDQAPLSLGDGSGAYTATIPQDAYVWEAGSRTLRVRELATGDELGTVNLTVNPYVCAVQSIVANPNPVGHVGNGSGTRLAQDVTVTVTTTGPCSGLELEYRPRNSDVTVALTGGPNTWTATIPGGGSVRWDLGVHVLTVLIGGNPSPVTGSLTVT